MSKFVVAPGMVVHRRDEWTHNCDAAGCRPVAVIGYEDITQVERLLTAYNRGSHEEQDPEWVTSMQAALREFAAPTPPKPAEPQGLGAVVEDAEGVRWVRAALGWWHSGETARSLRSWDAIPAIRVLSEGV